MDRGDLSSGRDERVVCALIWLAASLAVAACTRARAPSAGRTSAAEFRCSDLVRQLRSGGFTVSAVDEIQQPFFTPRALVYRVEGNDLQVYEFPDSASAEQAAAGVGHDGGSVGASMVQWMAPPHFFRKGRVIAIYLGADRGVLDRLSAMLGNQFTGGG